MRTSDWAYYGLTYAGIFAAMTTAGIAVMTIVGPSEDAEHNRSLKRPTTPSPLAREDVQQR